MHPTQYRTIMRVWLIHPQMKPASDFDVENVPEDQEEGFIEMDLACGLIDLKTEEAVRAAETAMASGVHPGGGDEGDDSDDESGSSPSEEGDEGHREGDEQLSDAGASALPEPSAANQHNERREREGLESSSIESVGRGSKRKKGNRSNLITEL